jgi:hypothetical protein
MSFCRTPLWLSKKKRVGRELTVRRPRDIVPTNLVMLIGHTILSEGGWLLMWT